MSFRRKGRIPLNLKCNKSLVFENFDIYAPSPSIYVYEEANADKLYYIKLSPTADDRRTYGANE